MSTVSATTAVSPEEGLYPRIRKLAVAGMLTLVLIGKKALRVRQNPGSWFVFRIILGFAGASLVILPVSFWDNLLVAPVGLCMFLASILLAPAKPDSAFENKTRELQAQVVVNGGNYFIGRTTPVPVRLFVGTQKISVLDSQLLELLAVPCTDITSTEVTRLYSRWLLELHWSGRVAEFVYSGFFAEHHARSAQAAVARAIAAPFPAQGKARSASA